MFFYQNKNMWNHNIKYLVLLLPYWMASGYYGEGTFYGAGGAGTNGYCQISAVSLGMSTTVAINPYQMEGGQSCGKCVEIFGKGEGSGMTPIIGPYIAMIDNLCPECKDGDLDLGIQGDGRWKITWNFIDCQRHLKINDTHIDVDNMSSKSVSQQKTSLRRHSQ